MIKKIWTSSYVLAAGGCSSILLAAFYQVIEVWGFRKWAAPFVWIGTNSITLYLVSGVLAAILMYGGLLVHPMTAAFGAYGELAASLVFVGLILLIAYLLYRRRVFLRV